MQAGAARDPRGRLADPRKQGLVRRSSAGAGHSRRRASVRGRPCCCSRLLVGLDGLRHGRHDADYVETDLTDASQPSESSARSPDFPAGGTDFATPVLMGSGTELPSRSWPGSTPSDVAISRRVASTWTQAVDPDRTQTDPCARVVVLPLRSTLWRCMERSIGALVERRHRTKDPGSRCRPIPGRSTGRAPTVGK